MKWLKRLLAFVFVALLAAGLWGYGQVRGSLPILNGSATVDGLAATVRVERDAMGIVTITARDTDDLYRALGFVHAQERFFQMDLLRRRAAGELSALVGEGALPLDRRHRVHRMRSRAKARIDASAADSAVLESYADGVNQGLDALRAPPFEYLLLRQQPEPWRPEDSLLVVASMAFQLNDAAGRYESTLGLLRDTLDPALATFLSPVGTEWDAPVIGAPIETPTVPASAPAKASSRAQDPGTVDAFDENVGSNNWVVAGTRTTHGGALLANDMHLGHTVPNIWFRARLVVGERASTGVTLPGAPFIVVGTNGDIAWGFTNSNGDWLDLVELSIDSTDPNRYLTPDGARAFTVIEESIDVAGGTSEIFEVRETIWGPVIDEDHAGILRAARWTAHDDGAIDMGLGRLATARTMDEAIATVHGVGIPPQNFVVADNTGAIAWTIAGRIPKRFGFDGRHPTSWASGERGWDGWLDPSEVPVISRPESGLIWTANARVVDGEMLDKIGDGGYAFGARARQIRDDLRALESASEQDMLDVQLDDRAVFMGTWRDYFLDWVDDPSVRDALESGWSGHASVDSSGYRVVRELRVAIFEEVFASLTAQARQADERFSVHGLRQWDGPLWKLVSEKPAHLVPKQHEGWDAWMEAIVERTVAGWDEAPTDRTWGDARMSAIRHPLSGAVPWLSRFLDMPSAPLAGDSNMPRAQSSTHGASQRIVVSPGREAEALFHMPGGQSGHPLSPFYGSGHDDWLEGRPTPLLPRDTMYTLELQPG